MPRVVPSQVVALIDQMFPGAKNQRDNPQGRWHLEIGHAPALDALLTLADQIPPELLPTDTMRYRALTVSLAAIRTSIGIWIARGGVHPLVSLPGFGDLNPVTLIRRALDGIPDEAPTAATVELAFIADQALRDSIRLDISAAHRDYAQGEWKGATALAGSAIEALLLWALQDQEQKKSGTIAAAIATLLANKTFGQNPGADPEATGWHLHQYIEVAEYLKFIEPDTAKLVRLAKDFRNLIHGPSSSTRPEMRPRNRSDGVGGGGGGCA